MTECLKTEICYDLSGLLYKAKNCIVLLEINLSYTHTAD